MKYQRTIRKHAFCSGIGLHSGKPVKLSIKPSGEHSGIVFKRIDLPGSPTIKATWEHISDTRLATTLSRNGVTVSTVEHIMAALAGMGIDNAIVELNAGEVPIMDGSAAAFTEMIKNAGIYEQKAFKKYIMINGPVIVEQGDARAALYPSVEQRITCSVDYDHSAIEHKIFSMINGDFSQVHDARTFGFLKDVEYLKNNGLALGGSLENAVVLDDIGVLNTEGLRYPDEIVRHKVLDSVGDLYLLGHPVIGHFYSHKGGHTLTHKLARHLFSESYNWKFIEFSGEEGRSSIRQTSLSQPVSIAA